MDIEKIFNEYLIQIKEIKTKDMIINKEFVQSMIKPHTKQTWEDYKSGKIDFFDFVDKSEEISHEQFMVWENDVPDKYILGLIKNKNYDYCLIGYQQNKILKIELCEYIQHNPIYTIIFNSKEIFNIYSDDYLYYNASKNIIENLNIKKGDNSEKSLENFFSILKKSGINR